MVACHLRRNHLVYVWQTDRLWLQYMAQSGLPPDTILLGDPVLMDQEALCPLLWEGRLAPELHIRESCYNEAQTAATAQIYFYLAPQFFEQWGIAQIAIFPEISEKGKVRPGPPLPLTRQRHGQPWSVRLENPVQAKLRYRAIIYPNQGNAWETDVEELGYPQNPFSLPHHYENLLPLLLRALPAHEGDEPAEVW